MTLALVALAAACVAAILWRAGRAMFDAPVLARTNYRGADIPVGAGVILVASRRRKAASVHTA